MSHADLGLLSHQATVLEEMPPFPERESSILAKLKKKKGPSTVTDLEGAKRERGADINGGPEPATAGASTTVGPFLRAAPAPRFGRMLLNRKMPRGGTKRRPCTLLCQGPPATVLIQALV